MGDIKGQIEDAFKQGYTADEIAKHLESSPDIGHKVVEARKAGYSANQILGQLGSPRAQHAAQVAHDALITMHTPRVAEPLRQFDRQATLQLSEMYPAAVFATGEKLRGRAGWGEAYHAAREAQEAETKAYASPLNTAAGVVGGIATPVPYNKVLKGGTLATRLVKAAGVGAAVGGIDGGASAKSLGAVPREALRGAGVGAVAGTAVKGGGEVAGRVARSPVGRSVGGVIRATAEAGQRTLDNLGGKARVPSAAAVARGDQDARAYLARQLAGSNPANHPAARAGKPITVAETLGPRGIQQVTSLARRPGETAARAKAVLSERQADTPNRLMADFEHLTGVSPENARAGVRGVIEAGQKRASPLFDRVREDRGPVINKDLAALAERPEIKAAIGRVVREYQNAGKDPLQAGLRIDPVTGAGAEQTGSLAHHVGHYPNAETWDAVRQAMAQGVKRDPVTGRALPNSIAGQGNYGNRVATEDLTKALRQAIPGYSQALDVAGDYQKVRSAFDRAKDALWSTQKIKADDFQKLWGSLKTEPERLAARHALAASIMDRADNGRLKPSALALPSVRKKLEVAFGKDATKRLSDAVRMEEEMHQAAGRMMPGSNSTTAEAQAHAAEHDAEFGKEVLSQLGKGKVVNALGAAVTKPIVAARDAAVASQGEDARNALGNYLLMTPGEFKQQYRVPPRRAAPRDLTPAAVAPTVNVLNEQRRSAQ